MNNQRKRELKEAYRTSRPPMGVLSFRCVPFQPLVLGLKDCFEYRGTV